MTKRKFICVESGMGDVNADLIQFIGIESVKNGYEIYIYVLGLKRKLKYAFYSRFGYAQIAQTELTKRIEGIE